MSLRVRFAVILGAVAFVAIAVASSAAYVSTERELRAASDRLLTERLDLVRATIGDLGSGGRGGRPRNLAAFERLDIQIQVVRLQTGDVIALGEQELPVDERVWAFRDAVVATGGQVRSFIYDTTIDGTPFRVLVGLSPAGVVMVGLDTQADTDVLAGLRNRLVVIGVIGTAVAAAIGWELARRITRPIERLTVATTSVARTQELNPIAVDGDGEVGRLAAAFNSMMQALRSSKDQQRRLVEDASHELKTPLTSLRTNVELLRTASTLTDDDRAAILDDLNVELVELTDLVGELVDLARDAALDDEAPAAVQVDAVVRIVAERAARRSGRDIEVEVEPTVARCRPAALERAVANLIANAVKFSPDGSTVDVTLSQGRFAVRDRGPGVAPDDRPHIFERFYRSQATRAAPGSGLGLSIVAQFVADAGGTTFVEDAPGGGAVIGFELPVVAEPPPAGPPLAP